MHPMFFLLAQSNLTDSILEVVAYEARRLFRDRLVSSKDLHNFENILSSLIHGDWGSDVLDNMTGTKSFRIWLFISLTFMLSETDSVILQMTLLKQFMSAFTECHSCLKENSNRLPQSFCDSSANGIAFGNFFANGLCTFCKQRWH